MDPAKFEKWKQRDAWTLFEAVALSLGREPMKAAYIQGGTDALIDGISNAELREQFGERYAQLKDAVDLKDLTSLGTRDGRIRNKRIKPQQFLAWAKGKGFRLPAELNESVVSSDSVSPKERESLLKFVAYVAHKLNWDPSKNKNSATATIVKQLKNYDIEIDEKTVRRWVNEAIVRFPRKQQKI